MPEIALGALTRSMSDQELRAKCVEIAASIGKDDVLKRAVEYAQFVLHGETMDDVDAQIARDAKR